MKKINFLITLIFVIFPLQPLGAAENDASKEDEHDHDDHDHSKEKAKPASKTPKVEKKHDHDEKTAHGKDQHKEDEHKHEEGEHEDHEEGGHEHGKGGHTEHEEGGHGHDEHGSSSVGKDKAITSVENDGERFELNEKAIKILKISTTEIKSQGKGKFQIPKVALVSFRDEYGIYVKRGNDFQLLETSRVTRQGETVLVELKDGGEVENVVTSGVALLRVAHLQASGQGGEGHVH